MTAHLPVAMTASLIADPARAAILVSLLDGRSLAAGELARCAGISAQSASMHLAQLLQSGFVEVASQGRHRYYRIASPEVAHAVEALGAISSPRKLKPIGESEAIRYARSCYDHLAGELGVALAESFEKRELIAPFGAREYLVTEMGRAFFGNWGLDLSALSQARKILARRCLDWTQRRYHIAGPLGAAIYRKMLGLQWIERSHTSRVLHVTEHGRKQLKMLLADVPAQDVSVAAETFTDVFPASSQDGTSTRTESI